nr:MAG TPA: hypothetical protein [Caudoviricetes sp.]
MLLVTISSCLLIMITIDGWFWVLNPTHKLGYESVLIIPNLL